jgi:hypothetical protein
LIMLPFDFYIQLEQGLVPIVACVVDEW